jgi:hypothetical protein
MHSPTVYCLSASDRYNYGDVLFPIVAKYALEQCGPCQFINVATIESDLTAIGGLKTLGYDQFLDASKRPKNATILVAGGQVMGANWMKLLGFTNEKWQTLYEKYKGTRMERRVKKRFGLEREPYPFILSNPELLNDNEIVYHAIGGNVPKMKPVVKGYQKALRASAYLSVRERFTRRIVMQNLNLEPNLVPDSVMLYSDIKPKTGLEKPFPSDYVCVQFGYEKSANKLPEIVAQLKKLHDALQLPIGLLSIGNCPGHDDIVTAEWIEKHADFPVFKLSHSTLDKVTSAIAHATLFIGTSLHGAIVSMSYGNPFVAVNKKINKLNAYTNTWAPDYLKGCVDFDNIAEAGLSRLNAHQDYSDSIAKQKAKVTSSFEKIYDIVKKTSLKTH